MLRYSGQSAVAFSVTESIFIYYFFLTLQTIQEILHVLFSLSAYQDQQGVQLWCLVFYMSTYRKASKKIDHDLMKNKIIKGLSVRHHKNMLYSKYAKRTLSNT